MPYGFGPYFPFRRNNRKPDGTWDAPDSTDENIKGTSVDPHRPMWPRWKHRRLTGRASSSATSPSSTSTRSARRRNSIRPASRSWTRMSAAIPRAANELAICPAAISGDGDSLSNIWTRAVMPCPCANVRTAKKSALSILWVFPVHQEAPSAYSVQTKLARRLLVMKPATR